MERFTEEEWALFTSIYDEGVQAYRLDIGEKDDEALNRIRDKIYDLIAPEPKG